MTVQTFNLEKQTKGFTDIIDITEDITTLVKKSNIPEGLVTIFVPGSTGSITTVEYEPGLLEDLPDFFEKIKIMLRMLRAYINGDYRQIPWKSLMMIIGSLIYFMMPLDLIPDFIPVTGFADDIAIIFLVFSSINEDIASFLEFERSADDKFTDDRVF